ncbi:MAG TPA: DNA helicase RecG, partial [Candidatus Hydrogenedentes bacterium]|nr:DNA helicase RecG [Candidatus Hydrogenedentota bacterium]
MGETTPLHLDDPIETLPGIGPKRAGLLANLGIATVRELLFHLPRDYQDRRRIMRIADAVKHKGESVTIEAKVVRARSMRLRRGMSMTIVELRDSSGDIKATFFGRGSLFRTFEPGARGLFTGVIGEYKGPSLKSPDYEMLSGDAEDRLNTGRVVPIYRLTQKLTQRMLRKWVACALQRLDPASIDDPLPERLRLEHGFLPAAEALQAAHFPDEMADGRAARKRFAYEELLAIQLGILSERAA